MEGSRLDIFSRIFREIIETQDIFCTVLRACRKDNPESEEAKLIESKITQGQIVPTEITLKLLKAAMDKVKTSKIMYEMLISPTGSDVLSETNCQETLISVRPL